MTLLIRTAAKADAPSIAAHNIAMAQETEDRPLDPNIVGPGVAAVFEDPSRGFYLVIEDEGKVIANLMITYEWSDWRNGNMWWFQSVYVQPAYRGKSLFSMMYDKIMEMAREQEIKEVRLYVEHENNHAQKVYEKKGMKKSYYYMYEVLP